MTTLTNKWLGAGFTAILGLCMAPVLMAIEFGEVKDFDEVFRISGAAPDRGGVEVRWEIEDGYYLYNNRFLQFATSTEGVVLGDPQVPPGKVSFDELLGEEVEKYHGELVVKLPLESVPPGVDAVQLEVRSQGCLENELCYPPTGQSLRISLPAPSGGLPPAPAANPLAGAPTGGLLGGGPESAALQPEEAFLYEAIAFDSDTALVRFTAQPGYYLYVDKFHFAVTADAPVGIRGVEWPEGVVKDDPEFGPVPVYYGQVEVPVHFDRPSGPAMEFVLEADFQGCRDGDICYPPMSRTAAFTMPAGGGTADTTPDAAPGSALRTEAASGVSPSGAPVSEQDRLARLLTGSPVAAIFAFFVAGLLLAFTPCVFPMVPILSGIIVGQGDRLTTLRAFWLSIIYVLAMAVTYTVAGVLAGLFGQNLQAVFQNPWIIVAFVLIFVLLALSMFGFYDLQVPGRLQTRLTEASNRQEGGGFWGVAVMGFLSALIVGPCVAPPLMAALIVIGSSGDAVLGGSALFALSIGMGVPLILFGVSAGKLVPRAGAWMDAVKAVFGVGLLALAIWMLERILPGAVIMLLWGALAIACGIYLGALERVEAGSSGWKKLWKSLGVLLLVLGILELVGAAAGGDYWLRPLEGIRGTTRSAAEVDHAEFARVKSLSDLDRELDLARGAGRGAMFDFYADWCVECKRMERNTFPDSAVQGLMERMRLLQADVTANDKTDQELMRAFDIIGPPAILFFDRNGDEMEAYRLVGYFDPAEFAAHLERVLAAQ
jgi:thiol:disulfide interchange protein DsbD